MNYINDSEAIFEEQSKLLKRLRTHFIIAVSIVIVVIFFTRFVGMWQIENINHWRQEQSLLTNGIREVHSSIAKERMPDFFRDKAISEKLANGEDAYKKVNPWPTLVSDKEIVDSIGSFLRKNGKAIDVTQFMKLANQGQFQDYNAIDRLAISRAMEHFSGQRNEEVNSAFTILMVNIGVSALLVIITVIGVGLHIFKPMQASVLKSNKALSVMIHDLERTTELAESADRSKSEFLANMSHEIRTPMNGVMGMAELLSKTGLNEKQKMFTSVILSSSTALLTIINDILDFSKIEAGKLELKPSPFCLSEVISDVTTLVAPDIAAKNIEMIVRIQPGLADKVIGDVGRVRQILTNIIGNAVKFTEKGHVLLDVTGETVGDDVQLRFSVKDTGIGIPEGMVDMIFDKFSQVDGSSTRNYEGTGLGLAITKRLVGLMNGDIGCSSVRGEGSTFWFTMSLPIDDVAKENRTIINITDARILAVDDNPVNRSILLEQLESWKFEGKVAESGPEGLKMLRQAEANGKPFDAVILDWHMPGMNGLDVAREIRDDDVLHGLPIIMLTSVDGLNDEMRDLAVDAHLVKPARASYLLESIVDVVRKRPAAIATPNEARMPAVSHGEGMELVVDEEPACATKGEYDELAILVAEDNEINQMVFEQILNQLGHRFKIVENGKLAVDMLDIARPSIILMDVSMPVMNGHDATREIRRRFNGNGDYRPVIIGVTAHALRDDRDKCLEAGMDDYMSKPISPDLLAEKINQWMPNDEKKAAVAS